MPANIEIATLSVKPDVFHTESLVAHAAEIRRLGKRVITDVIEIGRHLTEVRTELRETATFTRGLTGNSAGATALRLTSCASMSCR